METIRFRLTASDDAARAVMSQVESLRDIEHVEEVDDLMLGMRDDSSSAGLPSEQEAGTHAVEVHAPDLAAAGRARKAIELTARELNAAVEFVDRF